MVSLRLDDATPGSRDPPSSAPEITTRVVSSGVLAQQAVLPQVGVAIGRYVVVGEVGRGGMARVVRAYDPRLQREVAIKLLHGAGDPEQRARIVREARAMAQLAHPNVVAVFDVEEAIDESGDPFVFVAMEYVGARTLKQWLEQPRPWPAVLAAYQQVARGLAAAHASGLVHRDVKPSNVFLGEDGRARIGDFGLARAGSAPPSRREHSSDDSASVEMAWDEELTAEGTVLGTPGFMAPEQHLGAPADARADQYSFCIALWEGLYGTRPFQGATPAELRARKQAGPPVPTGSTVPRWIHAVLARGLAPAPADRWPTMDALSAALAADPSRRRRRWIGAGVVLSFGLAALAWQRVALARTRAACERDGATIDEVWNDDARSRIAAGLHSTGSPLAEATWARTEPWLSTYASHWSEVRTQVCTEAEIERSRGRDALARAVECLEERRDALAYVIEVLVAADVEALLGAVPAAAGLPRLDDCQEDRLLARATPEPTDAAETTAVRRLLTEADALQRFARYPDAIARCEDALARADAIGSTALAAQARGQLGDLLTLVDQNDRAQRVLVEAYLGAAELGASDLAVGPAIELVHLFGYDEARFDDGRLWARLAAVELARLGGDELREASLADAKAALELEAGAYAEAQVLRERALEIRERVLGPEHPDVAASLTNLALVLDELGRAPEAKVMHERAIAVYEAAFGPDHPELAKSLNNLASSHFQLHEFAEAKALFERAIAIWEHSVGPEHKSTATALANLANVQMNTGEFEAAKAGLERALAIFEKVAGPEHPAVSTTLQNLAIAHFNTGDFAEAKRLYERALPIAEKTLGRDHDGVATLLNNMAAVFAESGDRERAEDLYRRALAIHEAKLGSNHYKVAVNRHSLATLLVRMERYAEAKPLYEESLAAREAQLGPEHPEVADSLQGLGRAHAGLHDHAAAERVLQRALTIREGAGVDVGDRATTRFWLAKSMWELGRDRARARALAMQAREEMSGIDRKGERVTKIDEWLASHR